MAFDADRVRNVAAAQIAGDPAGGAALCVIVDGTEAVNETWGLADAERGAAYTSETLQIVQSMGKGVIAAVAALLVGRGQLDPNERIASYWPEFGTPDKRDITVAQLMSHQAGLVYLDDGLTVALTNDRERLGAALAAQSPAWEPGTRVGYSPQVFGNYADFLFERASGKGFADLLRELTEALSIEMHVGLPAPLRDRGARVLGSAPGSMPELPPDLAAAMADPDSLMSRIMSKLPEASPDPIAFANEGIRDAFMPAANMFSNARSFAQLYAALGQTLSGAPSPLWSREALETATTELVRGPDMGFGYESAFALAFQKPSVTFPFARSPRAFGHGGAGGSLAMADPDAGIAMCWIATRYAFELFDARQVAIVDAIYSALG